MFSDIPVFRLDSKLPTTLKHRTCNTGQHFKETRQQNVRFSSYFRSEFHFREETFTVSGETPFSVFTSVSESIELGISLLIRVTEMLFLWLDQRLDQIIWF